MKILLIDGNSVGYVANNAKELISEGRQTQAIFHSIKKMWNLKLKYPSFTPLVLWDAHCQWRYDLLPTYKSKRDEYEAQRLMRQAYKEQRPTIQKAFELMGMTQVQHDGYEADDIAGVYANKISEMPNSKAVMITGDEDWLQLVSESVAWENTMTGNRVNIANFKEVTGYATTRQFIEAKALHGDSSDAISGVGNIGVKTTPHLMSRFGSVKNLLTEFAKLDEKGFTKEHLPSEISRARNKINSFCLNEKNQQDILERNLKLMDLSTIKPPAKGFFRSKKPADVEAFQTLMYELGMITLATKAEKIFNDMRKR